MKQTDLGLDLSTRRTRKQILLEEMNQVMPWSDLLSLIAPHAPVAKTGRQPFDLALMLRIHCLQQWFGLSDLGAEEALFETSFYRDFVGISGTQRIPDRLRPPRGAIYAGVSQGGTYSLMPGSQIEFWT